MHGVFKMNFVKFVRKLISVPQFTTCYTVLEWDCMRDIIHSVQSSFILRNIACLYLLHTETKVNTSKAGYLWPIRIKCFHTRRNRQQWSSMCKAYPHYSIQTYSSWGFKHKQFENLNYSISAKAVSCF